VETRVLRHRARLSGFDLVLAPPHPALRGLVEGYQDFSEWAPAPVRRRELPGAAVVVIIDFGRGWRVLDPDDDPGAAGERHGSFVAGLDDRAGFAEHPGEARCVQVDLTPLGARALLATPMHELARRVVPLDALLGAEAPRLAERLAAAPGSAARFALLDAALRARAARARAPRPDVAWAWRRLTETHGGVRVEALAAELGCSRRHLAARFRDEVGLPPKRLARLLRFRRAARLLQAADGPELAAIAAACGYADQAHFTRDVRAFAGITPSELLARRLPGEGGVAA